MKLQAQAAGEYRLGSACWEMSSRSRNPKRCEGVGMTAPIQEGSEAPRQEQDRKARDSEDPGERILEDARFG